MAERILIVKLSSMGDVVHTLPAARSIRAAFPHARLAWSIEAAHAELLRGQDWLDEVFVWRRGAKGGFRQLVRSLRRETWDAAIDFQGLLRSALIARLSGARRRVGFAPLKECAHWLYTDRAPAPRDELHAVERYHRLAAWFIGAKPPEPLYRPYLHEDGVPAPAPDTTHLFPLQPSEADRAAVQTWLDERGFRRGADRLVQLFPECRKDANRWPVEYFARLAKRLSAPPDVRVALGGGPGARELCDEIERQSGADLWRADGRFGLLASTELIGQTSVVVTGDTGPMHLAVAAGARIVALFGPASPLRTGPYCGHAVVLNNAPPCGPCFKSRCPLNVAPGACMYGIPVEQVYAAVLQQLASDGRRDFQTRRVA